jgi:hypothetical protein
VAAGRRPLLSGGGRKSPFGGEKPWGKRKECNIDKKKQDLKYAE